jgi:hypothetical protein
MIRTEIEAGICGFRTTVEARSEDSQNVTFVIASTCDKIRALAERIGTVDAYAEIGAGRGGTILGAADALLKGCCAGCVTPAAIFKTMQVAAGLALPARITITTEKAE